MCPWADCWCKRWPPVRLILSTGVFYTWSEMAQDGRFRVFEILYREAA